MSLTTTRNRPRIRVLALLPALILLTVGICVGDARAQSLYWLDVGGGRILRAQTDGSDLTTIMSGLNQPNLLAIDDAGGFLFYRIGQYSIYRAGLDGSNPTLVHDGTDGSVYAMEFNAADGMLYFHRGAPYYTIFRMFADGSGKEEFVNLLDTTMWRDVWGIDFNHATGEMYTSTYSGRTGWIYTMPMDNPTNFTQIFTDSNLRCIDIRVDSTYQKIYWIDTLYDLVYSANADGSNAQLVSAVDTVTTLELDEQQQKLYRDDQFIPWGIHRTNVDGTEPELVLDNGARANYIRLSRPACMSLDVTEMAQNQIATITVNHDPALGPVEVAVVYSLSTGSFAVNYVDGWCVNLGLDLGNRPLQRVVCYGTTSGGELTCDVRVPRGSAGLTVNLQAAMRLTCPGVCQSPVVSTTIVE